MSKSKTTRTSQTAIRERIRAARAAQLEEQRMREQRIEDAATAFFVNADRIDRLAAERERVLEEFVAKHALLERDQGRAIRALRELETVTAIADVVGVPSTEVTRLSKLEESPAPRTRAERTADGDEIGGAMPAVDEQEQQPASGVAA